MLRPAPFPRWLLAAAALALPAGAHAATHLDMSFSGVVVDGAQGRVSPYLDTPVSTSFAGQPMTLSLSMINDNGNVYVDGFSAQWSQETYIAPFTKSWSGAGLPMDPLNDWAIAFYSTVSLTDAGGSIHIFPTFGFIAATDSDFDLTIDYSLDHQHNAFGSFSDGLTGGGRFDSYLTFVFDPDIGPYDASSTGNFALSRIIQTSSVPEPSTWAMLTLGFVAVAVAARKRAGRVAAKGPAPV